MTASRTATAGRLFRLSGGEAGEGSGLPLPSLFSALLNELLDHGPATTARMTEVTRDAMEKASKARRVAEVWKGFPDPVEALAADVLGQMEHQQIISQGEDGLWRTSPEGRFATGVFLKVIPARDGRKANGTTVWPKAERDRLNAESRERAEQYGAAVKARKTWEDFSFEAAHRGSRSVTAARKNLILESIRQLGDLREYFPVLLDAEGHVVDGRHRLAIDPAWPAASARVPVEKRLAAQLAANRSSAWTPDDWKTLRGRIEATAKKTEATRTLIRLALLEDASRSNRDIGRLIGCAPNTVQPVREELESTAQIAQYLAKGGQRGGRGVTTGTVNGHKPAAPKSEPGLSDGQIDEAEQLGLTRTQIMERYGVGDTAARRVENIIAGQARERARQAARPEPALMPAEAKQEPTPEQPEPQADHPPEQIIPGLACMDCGSRRIVRAPDLTGERVPDAG